MTTLPKIRSHFRSLAVLVATGVSLLHASADPLPADLIRGLMDEEFRVRETAQAEILEWTRESPRPRALLLLEQARTATDPEVRLRCHDVLRSLAMEDYNEGGEGYMGITMIDFRAQIPGEEQEPQNVIVITQVMPDSPASLAGLRAGDIITNVNGVSFGEGDALTPFQRMIRELKPGKPATFGILRDKELLEIDVVLGRRPPMLDAGFFGQRMADLHDLARREKEDYFRNWLADLDK